MTIMNDDRPAACISCGCPLIYSDEIPGEPEDVYEDGLEGFCGDCY